MAERTITLTLSDLLMIRAIPLSPELQAKGEAMLAERARAVLDEDLRKNANNKQAQIDG